MKALVGRKSGTVFSYLLMAVEVLSSLLFTPFLIRVLGQAEYGVYSLSLSITTYFTLLDLGVGNAMVRYIAKYRVEGDLDSQRRFLGLAVVFYLAICVVMMALYVLLAHNMASMFGNGLTQSEIDLAEKLLGITVLNAGVTLLASVFDKVLIAYEYFSISKIIQIAKIVLRVGLQVALLILGFGSFGIVVANLAMTVLYGVATVVFVVRVIRIVPVFHGFDYSFAREILGYTFFVFIQMVATQINAMAGQVILGMVSSSVMLGIYAVGSQINQYYQQLAGGISGVTMPGIVALVSKDATPEQLEKEMVKVGRITLLVIGVVMGGFIAVGDVFVVLWAGAENSEAFYVAAMLMFPMLLALIQASGSQVLWAKGKHQLQALIKIAVALSCVLLTFALVPWNPLLGAALGSAVSCFFGDVVAMNIVFRREIGIRMTTYYRRMGKGIVPSIAISSLLGFIVKMFLPLGWPSLFIEVALIVLAYCGCLWLFGCDQYERNLFASAWRRVSDKRRFE